MASKKPKTRQGEEIELTAEDEASLDVVWDKIASGQLDVSDKKKPVQFPRETCKDDKNDGK